MTQQSSKFNITKEDLHKLPIHAYEGSVSILDNAFDISKALERVIQHDVVGLDTETKPCFQKGEIHLVSLLQLAIPKEVFLVRLQHIKMIPELRLLLENKSIQKVGVGIRDDINALQKRWPFHPQGFVDLADMAKKIGIQVGSVKKLTGLILGFRISKREQLSNWDAPRYSIKQIRYAATDAWVCLELYKALNQKSNKLLDDYQNS